MRNARLQAQDLGRTSQFVNTLLSKEDVKDLEKPEPQEPPKSQAMVNGNGVPFRTDPKARFSDPPAPPPQQPLPEKPDVPSLKRGPTERPKSGPPISSPIRQENLSQIIQLTEALNNAKRDIDTQTTRLRELETMLEKEREARGLAEDLARRLEESTHTMANGSTEIEHVSDIVTESQEKEAEENPDVDLPVEVLQPQPDSVAEEAAAALQSRIDIMDEQMRELRQQMEEWKSRCETVESDRDADRKTLAEMVVQLREEEARRVAAEERPQSSTSRRQSASESGEVTEDSSEPSVASQLSEQKLGGVAEPLAITSTEDSSDDPTLSRANTITPMTSQVVKASQGQRLDAVIPYASMLGVVFIGMGLMAYINGWQSPPPRVER